MMFFDTLKVMKDIVIGGIEAGKADLKLDELIEKSLSDYDDVLTTENKELYSAYKKIKAAYDSKTGDEQNALSDKVDEAKFAYLESLKGNSSLPKSFRNEISTSIEEAKEAENKIYDNVGKTMEKYAENDEQKAEIRKTWDDAKKK